MKMYSLRRIAELGVLQCGVQTIVKERKRKRERLGLRWEKGLEGLVAAKMTGGKIV